MILLIDNYDSFVYNLARYFGELGCDTHVARNDVVSVADVFALQPDAVVLSPGPCTPDEAGICIELVRQLDARVPVLGVCLGHQAIAAACGGHTLTRTEHFSQMLAREPASIRPNCPARSWVFWLRPVESQNTVWPLF